MLVCCTAGECAFYALTVIAVDFKPAFHSRVCAAAVYQIIWLAPSASLSLSRSRENLFALIAGKPSRLAPVAKQDGLSNGETALEHFLAVSVSLTVLAKPC